MMRLFKRLIWESKELQFILVTGLCLVQQFADLCELQDLMISMGK